VARQSQHAWEEKNEKNITKCELPKVVQFKQRTRTPQAVHREGFKVVKSELDVWWILVKSPNRGVRR
jgi:hypothetical protein